MGDNVLGCKCQQNHVIVIVIGQSSLNEENRYLFQYSANIES